MHAMEIESFENDVLRASFDELINMDIKIFEYN
jgi:inorganic pyrophosphatase/exopolyphosphatase